MRAGCLSQRDGALEPPVQPLDHGQLNCLADRPELPGASSLQKRGKTLAERNSQCGKEELPIWEKENLGRKKTILEENGESFENP
jgi:hypothetical protein